MFRVQENTNKNFLKQEKKRALKGMDMTGGALAKAFLKEYMPELKATIHHDPEAGMYCAYATDADALRDFILKFREIC